MFHFGEFEFYSPFMYPKLTDYSRYAPGDIVIFRSPYLYHGISPWIPSPMVPSNTCTPGRVSWVHFTHADVVEKLWNKPANYLVKNGSCNERGVVD